MNDANLERLEHLVLLNSRPPIDIDLVDQLAHEYERRGFYEKAFSLYFNINDIDRIYTLFSRIALSNNDPNSSLIQWYSSHLHPTSSSNPPPLSDKSYTLPFYPLHHISNSIKSATISGFHISFSTINLQSFFFDVLCHILKYHLPIQEFFPPQDTPKNQLYLIPPDLSKTPTIINQIISNFLVLKTNLLKFQKNSFYNYSIYFEYSPVPLNHPSIFNSIHPLTSQQGYEFSRIFNLIHVSYSQYMKHPSNALPRLSSLSPHFISYYDLSSLLLHHYFKSSPFFIL